MGYGSEPTQFKRTSPYRFLSPNPPLPLSQSHPYIDSMLNMIMFTSGRIRNILSDFGAFLAISQNTLLPISHVLKNLMKKLKISPFGKIGKCQNLAKYEK